MAPKKKKKPSKLPKSTKKKTVKKTVKKPAPKKVPVKKTAEKKPVKKSAVAKTLPGTTKPRALAAKRRRPPPGIPCICIENANGWFCMKRLPDGSLTECRGPFTTQEECESHTCK